MLDFTGGVFNNDELPERRRSHVGSIHFNTKRCYASGDWCQVKFDDGKTITAEVYSVVSSEVLDGGYRVLALIYGISEDIPL